MLPSLTTGSQGNTAQRPLLAKPTKPPHARVMRSRPVESWNGLTGVRRWTQQWEAQEGRTSRSPSDHAVRYISGNPEGGKRSAKSDVISPSGRCCLRQCR